MAYAAVKTVSGVIKRGQFRQLFPVICGARRLLSQEPANRDKKLFTPGPLLVSHDIKAAMLRDLGSRDSEFMNCVKYIRSKLVEIAGVSKDAFVAVPVQGSGTFAVEATISTSVPREGGKVLVLVNGAYGARIGTMCKYQGIPVTILEGPEDKRTDLKQVEEALKSETFTNVAMVHHETTSGVLHPVKEVGELVKKYAPDATFIVDAMSSFGAIPIDIEGCNVDFLVSSANKCIEGVPGFAFSIARWDKLVKCEGQSRVLCLDLLDQHKGLEKSGQFRFTPPTHTMLAFQQALKEFEAEGGVEGRGNRYKTNRAILKAGMKELGFKELLAEDDACYIITSFYFPNHPNFDFKQFYERLSDKGQVIYPGKVTQVDCFRIGNIGRLYPEDMTHLLECIKEVCSEMNVPLPLTD